jgi:hypothetical protein
MDSIFFNCNVSKIFFDAFNDFSNGYQSAADLIITTMFAEYGIYDIINKTASEEDIIRYADARSHLQSSYIWSDLFEVSDMLRCSYLYKTVHKSLSYLHLFNDDILNNTTKQFKNELIVYLQQHSKFLSYCDLEQSGLFLYTNNEQALDKDKFIIIYNSASKAINDIYKKYQGGIPKVLLISIQQIKTIIDVREIYGETLVVKPLKSILMKCLPAFDKTKFVNIIFHFQKCNLQDLHLYLETFYSNICLLHVISSIDWVVLMQGRIMCHNCFRPIQEVISVERFEYLKLVVDTIDSPDTPFMKQELMQLGFLRKSVKMLKNNNILQNFSLNSIGSNNQFIIGNATRLYLNNIKLITYADLLFIGMYDIVERTHLPSHKIIYEIITSAEKDLKAFQELMRVDFMMFSLSIRTTHTFKQSLKKMKRFYRWLKKIQCDDLIEEIEIQEGINLIFGDVVDGDGQPTICPICLDRSDEEKETWWKLQPCHHMIHLDCYNKLFETEHSYCPMCRIKII